MSVNRHPHAVDHVRGCAENSGLTSTRCRVAVQPEATSATTELGTRGEAGAREDGPGAGGGEGEVGEVVDEAEEDVDGEEERGREGVARSSSSSRNRPSAGAIADANWTSTAART